MRNLFQNIAFPICLFSAVAFTDVPSDLQITATQNTIKDSIPVNDFHEQDRPQSLQNDATPLGEKIFIRAQLSKTDCFVGEPVVVTYKLYSSVDSRSKIIRESTAPGFSKINFNDGSGIEPQIENYHGQRYQVHLVKKTVLIPQLVGNLDIGQIEMIHKLYVSKKNSKGKQTKEINDLIHGIREVESSTQIISFHSKSLPVKLLVRELPVPAPNDFSGAIGNFQIAATTSANHTRKDDIIRVEVDINGSGNLEGIDPPRLSLPAALKLVSARQISGDTNQSVKIRVNRRFEYMISAEDGGTVAIPPVMFQYFDPVTAKYRKIQTAAMPVVVTAPATAWEPVNHQTPQRRYLIYIPSLLFATIVLFIIIRKQRKKRIKAEKNAQPVSVLDAQLIRIEQQIIAGDPSSYQSLHELLWHSFSESLNLRPTELNRKNVLHELDRRGWDERQRSQAEYLINAYEEYLYLPGLKKVPDLHLTFQKTRDLLSKLDQE